MHHRDLCAWTLYHKHMIVSHVSHQAVLMQREKRVVRSSWYPCFHGALLCWDTTHKIPNSNIQTKYAIKRFIKDYQLFASNIIVITYI